MKTKFINSFNGEKLFEVNHGLTLNIGDPVRFIMMDETQTWKIKKREYDAVNNVMEYYLEG